MRIAIIGSGISGLVAAHELHQAHDITVFEASEWIGGHTHTLDVECDGRLLSIDTGFIVFNELNYPRFCTLLQKLGVQSQPTNMSFSVRCDRSNLEYSGGSFRGLLAQKRNVFRPRFWRMLSDLTRFHREAERAWSCLEEGVTVRRFVEEQRYGREFVERFLLPMGASLWSCPQEAFELFPMRLVIEFFRNHRMLQSFGRPTWRVIRGGSRMYVDALIRPFRQRIRTRCAVRSVRRDANHVFVKTTREFERFDHVVFACHADQALALLSDPDLLERKTLASFPYQPNDVVLHSDTSMLPRRRAAWSAWNFRIPSKNGQAPSVTYNMNILQSLEASKTFCVSLNASDIIRPDSIIARFTYHHPTYDGRRAQAWAAHSQLACRRRTSFCGAYWGYGFHEDGVASALRACNAIRSQEASRGTRVVVHPMEGVIA